MKMIDEYHNFVITFTHSNMILDWANVVVDGKDEIRINRQEIVDAVADYLHANLPDLLIEDD